MKQTLYFRLCLLVVFFSCNSLFAQPPFKLNAGGTTQKGYLTTIPYVDVNSKVIISAEVNGKQCRFIVDTGACTTISKELFDVLHPDVVTTMPVRDAGNSLDSLKLVSLKAIKLGDITFNDIPAFVGKADNAIFNCLKVDGLIGSNLLRSTTIQFGSGTRTVVLTDDSSRLKTDKKNGAKMDLDAVQSNPYIWVTFKSKRAKGRDNVLFDSGLGGFYQLSQKSYIQTFSTVRLFDILAQASGSFSFGFHGAIKSEEHYRLFAPKLEINNASFKNSTIDTGEGHSYLGADLFKYGIVTLDYINKMFYFAPFSKEEIELAEKQWPYTSTYNDGKLVVGIVWDKKWEGKINVGDQIISLDGISYENAQLCELLVKKPVLPGEKGILVLKDSKTAAIKTFEICKE